MSAWESIWICWVGRITTLSIESRKGGDITTHVLIQLWTTRYIEAVYDTRGICVLNDVGVGSNERLRSKDKGKVGG